DLRHLDIEEQELGQARRTLCVRATPKDVVERFSAVPDPRETVREALALKRPNRHLGIGLAVLGQQYLDRRYPIHPVSSSCKVAVPVCSGNKRPALGGPECEAVDVTT